MTSSPWTASAEALKVNASLETIDFSSHKIGDDGAKALAEADELWKFYGDLFSEAVEDAFAALEDSLPLGAHTTTKEKRRIRDKVRKAGQALQVDDSTQLSTLLWKLVPDALDRLSGGGTAWAWFDRLDWATILAAFVAEAWPRFGTVDDVLPSAQAAVETWCRGAGRPLPAPMAPAPRREEPSRPDCGAARWLDVPQAQEPASSAMAWIGGPVDDDADSGEESAPAMTRATAPAPAMPPPPPGRATARLPPEDPRPARPVESGKPGRPDAREIEIVVKRVPDGEGLKLALKDLTVAEVLPGSICAGLVRPGDAITAINGTRPASQEIFVRELRQALPGPIRLSVLPRSAGAPQGAPSEGPAPPSSMPPSARAREPPAPPRAHGPPVLVGFAAQPEHSARTHEPRARGAVGRWAEVHGAREVAGVRHRHPATSELERGMVVLNCEDIGRQCTRSPAFSSRGGFEWEGVWRAIAHYQQLGYTVQAVCSQVMMARNPPPPRVAAHVAKCPVIDEYDQANRGNRVTADRVFVLRLAQSYDCFFVDNSNYRVSEWEGHHEAWEWLSHTGAGKKIGYVFDKFGQFIPSRDVESLS